MSKKLVTSAENLASLDLLIEKKKSGKHDSAYDELIIIIIIIFGGVHPPHPNVIDDYPRFTALETISKSISTGFKGVSVNDLVELRNHIQVTK